MLHGDLHLRQTRLFTQIKSGIESGRKAGPRSVDQDDLDLHQMFLETNWKINADQSLTLRIGRQELFFGSRRFINYRERPNVRLSFDGVKLKWHNFSWTFTGFATKPVEVDPGIFDDAFIDGHNFLGVLL